MVITKPELREIAKAFLFLLNREKIDSNEDISKKLGTSYKIGSGLEDFVSVFERHPDKGELLYVLNYIQKDQGIPIEIRVNSKQNYGEFIVTCSQKCNGYEIFGGDASGNSILYKKIKPEGKSFDFYLAKNELRELSKLPKDP